MMARQYNTNNVSGVAITQSDRLRQEAADWLLRLTSGAATQADASAFREWCARSPAHRRAFAESRRLWHLLGDAAARADEQPEALDAAFNTAEVPRYDRRTFLRHAMLGGAAACAGWVTFKPVHAADYETAVGEQRSVRLAEVAIELNTGTRLNADTSEPQMMRLELLAGEAEISTRDARQQVALEVPGGNVLAAAAGFNVRVDERGSCITCLHGSLLVGHHEGTKALKADQQILLAGHRASEIYRVDRGRVSAWRQQLLIFDNEPLARVIAEINRYRPGRLIITNEALGQRRVQARFTLDQLADVALLIRDAYGASLVRIPGNIVLLR